MSIHDNYNSMIYGKVMSCLYRLQADITVALQKFGKGIPEVCLDIIVML